MQKEEIDQKEIALHRKLITPPLESPDKKLTLQRIESIVNGISHHASNEKFQPEFAHHLGYSVARYFMAQDLLYHSGARKNSE